MQIDPRRIRQLNKAHYKGGPIVYWMSRDQRVIDNWALLFTQELAATHKATFSVIFCLVPTFLGATIRQYGFMIRGLQDMEMSLSKKNIPFSLLTGDPQGEIAKFINENKVGAIVTDFSPLSICRHWKDFLVKKVDIPIFEVDAHNIIPCWVSSPKQEYGAYTIRPKIHRLLPEFLDEFPKLVSQKFIFPKKPQNRIDWKLALSSLNVDMTVGEVDWIKPGEKKAMSTLNEFIDFRLSGYDKNRNDPNKNFQSGLSPYIHFGHISPQRIALEVKKAAPSSPSRSSFLEELIVRRELSDNFCFYNESYFSISGFPRWAANSLEIHRKDRRDFIYSKEEFEIAKTHDQLWNAAQMEMVETGKMHGFMRMYWAKKILEWTKSPEEALKIAIYLNDKYELDGRDPNGYAGISWSIGGLHDRAWGERPVFGKIRYMSFNGCRSKFDVKKYISNFSKE